MTLPERIAQVIFLTLLTLFFAHLIGPRSLDCWRVRPEPVLVEPGLPEEVR